MRATAEGKERLGDFMEARRLQLDLLWEQVAERAELSAQGLRDIREGVSTPRSRTRRRIEKALEWTPGSIDLTYAGGDPVPMEPALQPATPAWRSHAGDGAQDESAPPRIPNWFKSELERRGIEVATVVEPLDVLRAIAQHNKSTLAELLLEAGLAQLEEVTIRGRPDPVRDAIEKYRRDVARITSSPRLSPGQKKEIRVEAAEHLLAILEKGAGTT